MKATVKKLPALPLFFTLLLVVLFSCNKDPYEIGFDLLPPTDTLNVRTTDTCTVEAFSVLIDSVRTDMTASLLFGSMLDPAFGKTTSSFYTHLRLSSEEVNFGDQPVLDSVVLVLFYNSWYGDTTTRQNLKVYEIEEDLSFDSIRYSNQHLRTYPQLLANCDFYPQPTDSVVVGKDTLAPHLRINLSKFSNYLGNKILYAPSDALSNNTAFTSFFKGLYVQSTPVNSGGALLSFAVTGATSKMILYFHDGKDPSKDSLSYEIFINEACARFMHYDHNRYLDAGQDLKRQVLNRDTAWGAKNLFLQGLGGIRVKVKFPYMKNFGNGKIVAINDALLLLKNYETDTTYKPPSNLTMLRVDSAGRMGYLIDENEGAAYFGGSYNATLRTYFFRITRHMQKVIMNEYTTSFDLYMYVTNPLSNTFSPTRIILNGSHGALHGDQENRLRLQVTYTVLN